MDPAIPLVVTVALVILAVVLVLARLRQPYVVGYILAGVLLGPFGFALISDDQTIARVGSFGVLMLVFFIGMELPLKSMVKHWHAPIAGTSLQILISLGCVWLIGLVLDWPAVRIVFLGFVISISSTAVILNILRERGELISPIGRDTTAITVAQDLAVIPMLVVLGFMMGDQPDAGQISLQLLGGAGALLLFFYIVRRGEIQLPLIALLSRNNELQVFGALLLCFGFAMATGFMYLSSALGAFLAGITLAAARQTGWVRDRLDPFRVVFVSLFFVSIGTLIDIAFLREHALAIALLVALVFLVNTLINTLVLRVIGHNWRESLYGGAVLSQIGEFSFILSAVGFQSEIISAYAYNLSIAVICLSLLLSPAWIAGVRKLISKGAKTPECDAAPVEE